jgi:hypothetical protein
VGYRPVPVDITASFCPSLQDCPGVHFHPEAQRALPAIIIGLIGEMGESNGQRGWSCFAELSEPTEQMSVTPSLCKTLLPRDAKEL